VSVALLVNIIALLMFLNVGKVVVLMKAVNYDKVVYDKRRCN